jgi:hypothetical protein
MQRAVSEFQKFGRVSVQKSCLFSWPLCIVSGVVRTRKETLAKLWTTNDTYERPIIHATKA